MGLLDRITRGEHGTSMASPTVQRSARGLLGKASSLRGKSIGADEAFEAAFVERVQRLPAMDSSPFTALSLLKAFQPFSAGLCLTLKDDSFECVTAVGLESAAERIPTVALFPPTSSGPHRIGAAGDFGIASASPEAEAWAFPVAPAAPPYETVLILVEEPGKPLATDSLARVITACAEHFTPARARHPSSADGLGAFLSSALKRSPCQLIILERKGSDDLAAQAAAAVASFGSAFALAAGRTLIAVPSSLDRELLAHRLAKSLSAVATAGAEVSSPASAQEFLKAYS